MKKACIISGGGSFGAYGAGTIARINNNYDTVIGISTGAMMSPFVSIGAWDVLKEAYTNFTFNNIFDKKWYLPYPINKDGEIRIINILFGLLSGKNSISTSKKLRKSIDKYFTKDHYYQILKNNKNVIVGVQNISDKPSKLHYFNIKDTGFEDFKDWMWGSANAPFFTTIMNKDWTDLDGVVRNGDWTDGGLTELVALNQLKGFDYDDVDIIIHRKMPSNEIETNKVNNLVDNVITAIEAMRYDIEFEYFNNKIKELTAEGLKINVYWLPRKLAKSALLFDKELMNGWYEEGYRTAFDTNRLQVFKPNKDKK
jgi:NTE family protein